MEKDNCIIKTIDTVLNNEDYLLSIIDERPYFNDKHLYQRLASTIDYYLLTRYPITTITAQEIKKRYKALNHRVMTDVQIKNVIDCGDLTHSFNGIEREYVSQYGFDFFDKLPEQERQKVLRARLGLMKLEREIGKNIFQMHREEENDKNIVNKELFLTMPSIKNVYYAKNTPERFYFGPVGRDSFAYFPMIVGESKRDYLKRILTYRIEHKTYKIEPQELIDIAENVVDYYSCKEIENKRDYYIPSTIKTYYKGI